MICSLAREILGLNRFDQAKSPVNLFGAEVNLAAVGSPDERAGGRKITRQLSAQSIRSLFAGGRNGRRSLSAKSRGTKQSLDAKISATKLKRVSGRATDLLSDIIESTQQQVAPAAAPDGDLTAATEKRIEDLLTAKMVQHEACLREPKAQDEEERARRLEEHIQAEVERRFRLLVIENSGHNNLIDITAHSVHPTPSSLHTPKLAPAVQRLMASAGGGSAAAERGGSVAAGQGGSAAAKRAMASAEVGDNAEVFSFKVGLLKRYLATRATAAPPPASTKVFQFSDQLADGAVDKYNQFRDNLLVELR